MNKSILKKAIATTLSIMLGIVFIYSGYTKLYPVIETFEFTFVDLNIANWYTAPVIARLLIGLEFFTGTLLISCFALRKITLPLAIFILVLFCFYLVALLVTMGNNSNCGCFGEHLRMTPLQALLKNLVMLGACMFVYLWNPGWTNKQTLFLALIIIPSFAIPFVVNPVDYSYTSNNLSEEVNYPLGIDQLYTQSDSGRVERPSIDLREGKHVVAFLSLTCSHCRIAAKKIRLIKKENVNLPVYFVLNGDKSDYQTFLHDTHAGNVPSSFCNGKTFIKLAGAVLPRIYYIDDGIVVKKVDYYELSQHDIEKWIENNLSE